MRIMFDTNFLISAFVFGGKIEKLLDLIYDTGHSVYVTEYVDSEFRRVVNKKFSDRKEEIFAQYAKKIFKIYPSTTQILGKVRDEKDIPVLSDAIFHEVDILLTGDKDFLESEIENPLIMSPITLFEYLSKNS